MKICSLVALGVGALLLAGCLVPERFSARVDLRQDGAYTFHYAGTVVHAMAAAQIKQAGALPANAEKELAQEAGKMAKLPDVKKAAYKGAGRYEMEIDATKKAGESLQMFDLFTVSTDKDGVITIASIELDAKAKQQLDSIGLVVDGTLEVALPKNAEVISQNATSTPTLFGLLGATYAWKISKVDQHPVIKVRLKQ